MRGPLPGHQRRTLNYGSGRALRPGRRGGGIVQITDEIEISKDDVGKGLKELARFLTSIGHSNPEIIDGLAIAGLYLGSTRGHLDPVASTLAGTLVTVNSLGRRTEGEIANSLLLGTAMGGMMGAGLQAMGGGTLQGPPPGEVISEAGRVLTESIAGIPEAITKLVPDPDQAKMDLNQNPYQPWDPRWLLWNIGHGIQGFGKPPPYVQIIGQ